MKTRCEESSRTWQHAALQTAWIVFCDFPATTSRFLLILLGHQEPTVPFSALKNSSPQSQWQQWLPINFPQGKLCGPHSSPCGVDTMGSKQKIQNHCYLRVHRWCMIKERSESRWVYILHSFLCPHYGMCLFLHPMKIIWIEDEDSHNPIHQVCGQPENSPLR